MTVITSIECIGGITCNALSLSLEGRTEVMMYNVSGRGPIGSQEGALYLFKDALAVKIGEVTTGLEKVKQMLVTAKAM